MKLVDLNPRWLMKDGRRIGILFNCPLRPNDLASQQCVFFQKTPYKDQWASTKPWHGPGVVIQHCNPDHGWACMPPVDEATFENISITPSIDGSAGGRWHGFVTNGEVKSC